MTSKRAQGLLRPPGRCWFGDKRAGDPASAPEKPAKPAQWRPSMRHPAAPSSREFSVLHRPAARLAFLLAILLLAIASGPAGAATPFTGTLSNATPTLTWTSTIAGAGSGENTCVNGTSCDTFQIVVAPG